MSAWEPNVDGWRRRELDEYETWAKDFYEWLDGVKAFVWDEGHTAAHADESHLSNPYRGEQDMRAPSDADTYLQDQLDRAEEVHPTTNSELVVQTAEQKRWELLGEITGSEHQRTRILHIVATADWSGEDLAQDRANLRQLILGFPL